MSQLSTLPVLVIGAGPCGLVTLKTLLEAGFPALGVERSSGVGGNWCIESPHSSVYESAHLISSKRRTEFRDYPMPPDYPPYPRHDLVLEYLEGYARHFRLPQRIRFQAEVVHCAPTDDGWNVRLADGEVLRGRALVVANGHHAAPYVPAVPGEFSGESRHTHDYKRPEILAGRRVLIVGAGNSGCDIAVEASAHAARTLHSLRRGYHFLPKFLGGGPSDSGDAAMRRWGLPLWLRRQLTRWLIWISLGSPERYGLPRPDHDLFETHPIINSRYLEVVGHGGIEPRGPIERLDGDGVRFADGSREPVDLLLWATGYRPRFPFLDPDWLDWSDEVPRLYGHLFHPRRDDLFVVGMFQPNSAIWPLAEEQARCVAAVLKALEAGRADAFRRIRQEPTPDLSGGIRFVQSARHALEVDHGAYREFLESLQRRLA